MNTKDNNLLDINKKLKYIGLDFNNIPEIFKEYEPLKYRADRNYNDHNYKIYKYVNVNDISILLTPANRLSSITEKYINAAPLKEYLEIDEEDNIDKHANFLLMLQKVDVAKIEEIEQEQKLLNKKIPFKIKYKKNYLWQIHYSEYTRKYFMLVTIEDLDYSAFFYLLKKQIENNKNEKIFVPISYSDYTGQFLKRSEINEIENCLWYFTKEWPTIYEVFDKNDNLSINIVGKTMVYEKIESDYKIKLDSQEDCQRFYKLLKSLFNLQTSLSNYYNFEVNIGKNGELEICYNGKALNFLDLPKFVKDEYIKACEEQNLISREKTELENKLEEIQKQTSILDKEYKIKEKQIAAFLECKKSFFGRVKYFLSKKGKNEEVLQEENQRKIVEQKKIFIVKKDFYTLEDLIYQYELLDKDINYVKNLKMDIEAGTKRIEMMKVKVENAKLYLAEIDEHKKSLFEFWKFTNQDKMAELTEGTQKRKEEHHLKRIFNYETDFEDYSKKLDKRQREKLSKEEMDSVYLLDTLAIKDINLLESKEDIAYNNLAKIKEEVFENNKMLNEETFDVLGNFMMINNNVKTLDNKKHKEVKKDISKILEISTKTELQEYKANIEKALLHINSAIIKIKANIQIPIYRITENEILNKEYYIFHLDPAKSINEIENKNLRKYVLHKISLNENSNILGLTNSVLYDNTYQTLPIGMNKEDKVIIKRLLLDLKVIKKRNFNIIEYEEQESDFSKINVKEIEVIEYNCI